MPRDGSQIYHIPPGTPGIPNATIGSTPYNGFLGDIEQDLNAPRPIVAGGTGATNAHDAMLALGGEIAGQVVTNYDSFPFVSGSFTSAAGATSAPVAGHSFTGIAYVRDTDYQWIEARDDQTSILWVRQKGGPWGAWFHDTDALDTKKVDRAGDTMTGVLTIATASHSGLFLNSVTGFIDYVAGQRNGLNRWQIYMPDNAAESSGNAGSNFSIGRYSDAGALIDSPLVINRANGLATFSGGITGNGVVSDTGSGHGTFAFGNNFAHNLTYDGADYALNGGSKLTINGNLKVRQDATHGSVSFGDSAYVYYDGANYSFAGGGVAVTNGRVDVMAPLAPAAGTGHINLGAYGDRDYWAIRMTGAADLCLDSWISSWNAFFTFGRQTGDFTASGFIHAQGLYTQNAQVGPAGGTAGVYLDGTNVALRSYGSGPLYFQSASGNLYATFGTNSSFGGIVTAANGRLWGANDFAAPVTASRLTYIADYAATNLDPYLGGLLSGISGSTMRVRAVQLMINGSWVTASAT
jgi:hypothetical protein